MVETQGGIGFRIHVADTSPVLNARGDVVQLYTYMQVVDAHVLFGFNDRDALTLFEQLLTVNGVGPAGLAIMSIGTVNQIKAFIMHKDAKSIAKAQGVGKKTAERVILELADKVSAVPIQDAEIAAETGGTVLRRTEQRSGGSDHFGIQ